MLPSGKSFLMECKKYLAAMCILDDAIEKTNNEKIKDTHAKHRA